MRVLSLKEMAKKIGPILGNPSAEDNIEEAEMEILRQFTRGVAGIEVWADPVITDDKDFTTIGITGYFPDVNKINFTGPLPGDPNSTLFPNTSRLSEDGKLWILTLSDPSAANSASVQPPGSTVPDIDADDLRREIYETKALLEMLLPSLAEAAKELPSDMGDRQEIIPGGKIVKAEGCETDGTKAWTFESLRDVLQRASKLVRDDEMILLLVREAKRQKVGIWNVDWGKESADSREMRRNVAKKYAPSRSTPVRVTIIPGEPVFNYAKEVTAARNSPNALMRWIRNKNDSGPPVEKLKPDAAVIGVEFSESNEIEIVFPNSPAARAGLRKGDRVISVDGRNLTDRAEVLAAIRSRRPGDKMKLCIRRGEQTVDIELTLAAAREIKELN